MAVNEKQTEKVIGWVYFLLNGNMIAADIYEGNYIKLIVGGVETLTSVRKTDYDKAVKIYQECVEKDEMIPTAYEENKRLQLDIKLPEITADPKAAEKEWKLRKTPNRVEYEAPVEKKSGLGGLFGGKTKTKKAVGIRCPQCGKVNEESLKFCGECGYKLPKDGEEVGTSATVQKVLEKDREQVMERHVEPVREMVKPESNGTKNDTQKAESFEVKEDAFIPDIPSGKGEKEVRQTETISGKVTDSAHAFTKIEEPETAQEESYQEEPPRKESKENRKTDKKKKKTKKSEKVEETPETPPKKKKKGKTVLSVFLVLLIVLLLAAVGVGAYWFVSGNAPREIYNSEETKEPVAAEVNGHVVIKVIRDIPANTQITEADLEGTILNEEQYEKYNHVSTYIDKDGNTKEETLLLWTDKSEVVGQYAARDLKADSILYDTSITSQHVIADKTFVEVDVDGEGKTYEAGSDVLPGNTKIQIIAVIQTEGNTPQQILLSEMTLQDRSLQSIFDSAGQDVLDMLSGESGENGTQEEPEEGSSDAQSAEGE